MSSDLPATANCLLPYDHLVWSQDSSVTFSVATNRVHFIILRIYGHTIESSVSSDSTWYDSLMAYNNNCDIAWWRWMRNNANWTPSQSAFDDYIPSSRELEEELDDKLARCREWIVPRFVILYIIRWHSLRDVLFFIILNNCLFAPPWKYQYLNAVLCNGRTTMPSYIQIYPEYRIRCDQGRIAQCHPLCAACQYAAADGMVQAWVGQKLLKRDILRVFTMSDL